MGAATTAPPATSAVPVPPTPHRGRRGRLARLDVTVSPYLYIAPFFVLFLVTGLFPLLYTGYVALHDWDQIMGRGEFVGLTNFVDILTGRGFWRALANTVSIFLLSSVPQIAAALLIAALLDRNLRARTFWRMGVLLPYVVAPVAVALIFNNLFADRFGLVNLLLETVGLEPVRWHSDRLASHIAIATMVNFRWTGYNALILLAAMQAIPKDLYEQAALDGANAWRSFWSVTVPMLRPTIIFVVITSTIGGLQIFDEPKMYDQYGRGGADQQWQTLTIYLYELGWTRADFGAASAVAVLLFLIIVTFGILNFLLTRRIAHDDGGRR
ncbi:sugar ABC transporter permease [Ornithinimicrobium humiphilum]|uniref:Cellobiose ABC transporter membrane protein n=1 Tax=Ornithinimicrobium humiphilum TaxID=125288 RepID=A0A543KLJ8_9MICO|nr:sugar ABC transporter permease [Ornithinimicrobium humiphilum]TQM95941.1 cellobiose ABC transporter membrane protein [Ornithinimicrobium humiphilum]